MARGAVRNWALLCLVNLFWAAQYPAYRVASESMGVAALNFWTFAIATIVLAPFLVRERKRVTRASSRFRQGWLDFLLLGSLGLIPPSVLLAWGIAHSSASNAAILALTVPVLMVLMAMLLLHEKPAKLYIVSLILALGGTVLMSRNDLAGGSFKGSTLAGNVAVFLGAAGSAFYNTHSKKVLERFSELEVLVYSYVIGMALCATISLATESVPFYAVSHWKASAWSGVLVLGAVSWGIAMVIWMWLLNKLEVGQISVAVYLLPVFGVLLSAVTLGEHLTSTQLMGGVVVLAAAFFSSSEGTTGAEQRDASTVP